MKLETNKNYFLNYARRQGKSRDLSNLAIEQLLRYSGTNAVLVVHNSYLIDQLLNNVLKTNVNKVKNFNRNSNTITFSNNSKLFLINSLDSINKLRGIAFDYLYVDEISYSEQFVKELLSYTNFNLKVLCVTGSINIYDLANYTKIFKVVNNDYQLIMKPLNLGIYTKEQKDNLFKLSSCVSELTLGLIYDF